MQGLWQSLRQSLEQDPWALHTTARPLFLLTNQQVPNRDLASSHYAEHDGKPFFPKLVNFLTSGPVVAMVGEGPRLACARAP